MPNFTLPPWAYPSPIEQDIIDAVNANAVPVLAPGSIPFANASGALAQDNARLSYSATTHGLFAALYDFGGQVFNVKNVNFAGGAKGDGATDDATAITAAITAAISAGGGTVYFPQGTYIVGSMIDLAAATKVHVVGAGMDATVIQLKNGANVDMFGQSDYASRLAGNADDGPHAWSISNLSIVGNRANNSAGNGLKVYAYDYRLHDVAIRDCANDGLHSAWTSADDNSKNASPADAMEGRFTGLKIHDCGDWGINFSGPHDSLWSDCIVWRNNQSASNSGNLQLAGIAAGLFTNCHFWGAAPYNNVYLNCTGNQFANCVFEGASHANLAINANEQSIVGCFLYDANAGGRCGLELLNGAGLLRVDAKFDSFNSGNAILFTNDGGNNTIVANIWQTTGTMIGGTKSASTTLIASTAGGATAPATPVDLVGLSVKGISANYYDFGGGFVGKPASAAVDMPIPIPRALAIPANMSGARAIAKTGATSAAAFTIAKVSGGVTTTIGTLTFAAAGQGAAQAGTFTTPGGAAQSLAAGDYILVTAPTQDATLADVGYVVTGTWF